MDIYGDSLRFVNKLLTRAYGHEARKVPAHMPHMINRDIMEELQNRCVVLLNWSTSSRPSAFPSLSLSSLPSRYPIEFDETSSHKVRSSDDMQFSFSYFYFLMSEKRTMDVTEAFSELDADQSGYVQLSHDLHVISLLLT